MFDNVKIGSAALRDGDKLTFLTLQISAGRNNQVKFCRNSIGLPQQQPTFYATEDNPHGTAVVTMLQDLWRAEKEICSFTLLSVTQFLCVGAREYVLAGPGCAPPCSSNI